MKSIKAVAISLIILPIIAACSPQEQTQVITPPIDVVGVYRATLPGSDCPRIKVVMSLRPDSTLSYHQVYEDHKYGIYDNSGTFHVDSNAIVIKLDTVTYLFEVRNDSLIRLDENGKELSIPLARSYNFNRTDTLTRDLPIPITYKDDKGEPITIKYMNDYYSENYIRLIPAAKPSTLYIFDSETDDGYQLFKSTDNDLMISKDRSSIIMIIGKKRIKYQQFEEESNE